MSEGTLVEEATEETQPRASAGKRLLAKIVQDSKLKAFSKLERGNFEQHELPIYDFIKQHVDRYSFLPTFDLLQRNVVIEEDIQGDVYQYYEDELINRVLYNKIAKFFEQAGPLMNNKKVIEVMAKAQELITTTESIRRDSDGDLKTMADVGDKVLSFIRKARVIEGVTGVVTGWPYLDKQTNGWQSGDLYSILARPKMGKSLLMGYTAEACWESGLSPLLVSMEMKDVQMGKRRYALKAGINMEYMKSGKLSSFAEEMIVKQIEEDRARHPFHFIEGQFKKSVNELMALIMSLAPDAVYIDAAYLLSLPYSSKLSKWERITEIAESLKTTATKANIPFVVSFQLNREATKAKTIGFEHIQLSDAIGQLSSMSLDISEEAPQDNDTLTSVAHAMRYINIIGGREGETGGFSINWRWDVMDFSQIDPTDVFSFDPEEDGENS